MEARSVAYEQELVARERFDSTLQNIESLRAGHDRLKGRAAKNFLAKHYEGQLIVAAEATGDRSLERQARFQAIDFAYQHGLYGKAISYADALLPNDHTPTEIAETHGWRAAAYFQLAQQPEGSLRTLSYLKSAEEDTTAIIAALSKIEGEQAPDLPIDNLLAGCFQQLDNIRAQIAAKPSVARKIFNILGEPPVKM